MHHAGWLACVVLAEMIFVVVLYGCGQKPGKYYSIILVLILIPGIIEISL